MRESNRLQPRRRWPGPPAISRHPPLSSPSTSLPPSLSFRRDLSRLQPELGLVQHVAGRPPLRRLLQLHARRSFRQRDRS
ncbi:hypothetical protein AAHA92_15637 [Salvia divinorum]|uniref:Uncharacterized protein n=1 Tax=Salvia divinorum TaxID=28513 RepID=A0ABD1HG08_SALDI